MYAPGVCTCIYCVFISVQVCVYVYVRMFARVWIACETLAQNMTTCKTCVSYSLPTQSQPTSLYRKKMLLAISLVVKSVHNKDLKRGWGLGDCQQGTIWWRERGGYRQIVINASHRWSIGDWTKSKFASCPCQLPYKTPLLGVPWVTLPIKSRPYH